ncbi:hypothetical protein HK096_008010, partial [Nowakowskiella sp. JEL0078]
MDIDYLIALKENSTFSVAVLPVDEIILPTICEDIDYFLALNTNSETPSSTKPPNERKMSVPVFVQEVNQDIDMVLSSISLNNLNFDSNELSLEGTKVTTFNHRIYRTVTVEANTDLINTDKVLDRFKSSPKLNPLDINSILDIGSTQIEKTGINEQEEVEIPSLDFEKFLSIGDLSFRDSQINHDDKNYDERLPRESIDFNGPIIKVLDKNHDGDIKKSSLQNRLRMFKSLDALSQRGISGEGLITPVNKMKHSLDELFIKSKLDQNTSRGAGDFGRSSVSVLVLNVPEHKIDCVDFDTV